MNTLNKKRVIFYIDGFSLYYGVKEAFGKTYKWLDLHKLACIFCAPDEEIEQINYFTSIVKRDVPKQQRQRTYIKAIKTLPKLRDHYGKYSPEHIYFNNGICTHVINRWREKMTDVNISVKMITDAFDNKFDVIKLITGDKDLKAPILEIKKRFPEKRIIVIFPPGRFRHPKDIGKICDECIGIKLKHVKQCLLPDQIHTTKGIISKPLEWY